MDELRADLVAGKAPKYHIIEIMACPGGCVAGGESTIPWWRLRKS
ncbi:MAG: [Fe-Fe] hydrogenase large subunit C-terminal domain-containing protein [Paeniclostridium sp.]